METPSFFTFYDQLPTPAHQKELRRRIIDECRIHNLTFYSWLRRKRVSSDKQRRIIEAICFELHHVNVIVPKQAKLIPAV